MIDSHCHLASTDFATDLPAVLQRAKEAGIERMVCIGDTIEESGDCLALARRHDQLFCTVGVHPHAAKEWKEGDADVLRSLVASSDRVRAIGEIGLDYHYDFSPREKQRDVFRTQLLLAKELKLPVVVHCREAVEDVWTIVSEVNPHMLVIHCCTEKFEDVERFVQKGYFLSFTGIATYRTADVIRACIRHCPLEQMMIETDAPYLAPVPHRGKRNEPAFVVEVAKLIADEKGLSLQEIDEVTTKNAVEFFQLP